MQSAITSHVHVEQHGSHVVVVELHGGPQNRLSTGFLAQIKATARDVAAGPPRAVVIWGGDAVFSRGGDPTEFVHYDPAVGKLLSEAFHEAIDAVAAIPCPTIAAITGAALGGGCELAVACDFRISADNAEFGQPEINVGAFPGGGGTQRLPRLIGSSAAKELIFLGEPISAQRALDVGLVNRLCRPTEVLQTAMAWATKISDKPVRSITLAKRAIDGGLGGSLGDGLALEQSLFPTLF